MDERVKTMMSASLVVEIGQMLSGIDLNPVQAALQGPNLPLLYEFVSDKNAVHYADRVGFEGYALQFSDETKGIVELEAIDKWGAELASMLYTYRSIARALPTVGGDETAHVLPPMARSPSPVRGGLRRFAGRQR